jgi:hypothetical protein
VSRSSGPRIRTLKPELWQDERYAGVSLSARLLYVGLVTQADDEGRQSANPALLRARIFPFDVDLTHDVIGGWLDELEMAELIRCYDAGGRSHIALVSWGEDQRVDKPTPSKIPAPPEGSSTIPRDSSRAVANVPASRAPADRTGPGPGPDHTDDADASPGDDLNADRRDVHRLCSLLAELMRANDPKAKVDPGGKRWRDACRLLIDSDGRTVAEVEQVIRFTQADDFERANVLSMPKLRQRFGQLSLKAQKHPTRATVEGASALADYDNKINEAA